MLQLLFLMYRLKTVVNEFGLSLAVYDYMDNNYFEQMVNWVVSVIKQVQ